MPRNRALGRVTGLHSRFPFFLSSWTGVEKVPRYHVVVPVISRVT